MATTNLTSFPETEDFECPACEQSITLHDPSGSEFVACPHCHVYIQFQDNVPKDKKQLKAPLLSPLLQIGAEANLKGVDFKVITYLEKKEKGTSYQWREYILYNYKMGYVTLSEFEGHWTFIVDENWEKPVETPVFLRSSVHYGGKIYNLYNNYVPVIEAMVGEADYHILDNSPQTREFISPPKMIILEGLDLANNPPDTYFAEYIDANEVAAAFKVAPDLFPSIIGIGAIEPAQHYERWENAYRICGVAIIVVLVLQLLVSWIKPEAELLNDNFSISPVENTLNNEFKSFVSPSFTLTDQSSSIEIEFSSAIDNSWMEATMVLVNENDNRTWEMSKDIEFYRGVENGESWSEGEQKGYILMPAIPAGKYHINVYPAAGDLNLTNLYIKATANTTMWRNALLTILAFMLYPFYAWIRWRNFEKKRWSNSDFSPYHNS